MPALASHESLEVTHAAAHFLDLPDPPHTSPAAFWARAIPFRDALSRRAAVLTRDAVAADDLVSETLTRAAERYHTIRTSNLQAWLLTIMSNLAVDEWRRRARLQSLAEGKEDNLDAYVVPPVADPAEAAPRWTECSPDRLGHALAQVPDELRDLLESHHLRGESYDALARRHRVRPGTVASRLFRARARLRQLLDEAQA
jgi:RNA polymerase sigma-70 factor (ECF subfamily)